MMELQGWGCYDRLGGEEEVYVRGEEYGASLDRRSILLVLGTIWPRGLTKNSGNTNVFHVS